MLTYIHRLGGGRGVGGVAAVIARTLPLHLHLFSPSAPSAAAPAALAAPAAPAASAAPAPAARGLRLLLGARAASAMPARESGLHADSAPVVHLTFWEQPSRQERPLFFSSCEGRELRVFADFQIRLLQLKASEAPPVRGSPGSHGPQPTLTLYSGLLSCYI